MTEPNQPPAADPGNTFLSIGPCSLSTTIIDTPAGQRMMATIRTASTTLTVFLERQDAENWENVINSERVKMTSLVLAPANVRLPDMNGHPHG